MAIKYTGENIPRLNPDFAETCPYPPIFGPKIPEEVIEEILKVYEFGVYDENMPNNLICEYGGGFWTTWDLVLSIKKRLEGWRTRNTPVGAQSKA